MVRLNRIYTRTGDDGTTMLADGSRVAKTDARVAAMGAVDETNAAIGIARLHLGPGAVTDTLAQVQNDLFDVGADIATPLADNEGETALRVTEARVEWIEATIDGFNQDLAPLTSFVLPGGTPASAHLHLARTIARRAETTAWRLKENGTDLNGAMLAYLNRLSDLLFVLSRWANDRGAADILWVPGGQRGD